jgi:hypothetical protein
MHLTAAYSLQAATKVMMKKKKVVFLHTALNLLAEAQLNECLLAWFSYFVFVKYYITESCMKQKN